LSEEKNQDKKNEAPSMEDLMQEIKSANLEIDMWFPIIPQGKLYMRIRMLNSHLTQTAVK
tara:strand:+ start:244 stop:423 length:180 start_codon:yes stop_codon:yes gene_type:complete